MDFRRESTSLKLCEWISQCYSGLVSVNEALKLGELIQQMDTIGLPDFDEATSADLCSAELEIVRCRHAISACKFLGLACIELVFVCETLRKFLSFQNSLGKRLLSELISHRMRLPGDRSISLSESGIDRFVRAVPGESESVSSYVCALICRLSLCSRIRPAKPVVKIWTFWKLYIPRPNR